jgi:hypothetical protein
VTGTALGLKEKIIQLHDVTDDGNPTLDDVGLFVQKKASTNDLYQLTSI